MKKILIILIICLSICGCNSTTNEKKSYLKDSEIKDIMINNDYKIIDVRTKEEYVTSHIKDAINIPYDEIDEKIDIDKKTILFVYCKSGNRSNIAYNTLTKLGYTVYDLGAYENIKLEKTIQ